MRWVRVLGVDRQGLRFLLDLLTAGGVVQENRGDVRLTRRFQTALRYRDLLEIKLDYAGFTINDFADLFTTLIRDGGSFMGKARLFELFDYRRALDPTIENYTRTPHLDAHHLHADALRGDPLPRRL